MLDRRQPSQEQPLEARRRGRALALLLVLSACCLPFRAFQSNALADALVFVEVRGLVPRPGFYRLDAPATAWQALEASGASPSLPLPDGRLPTGARLRFTGTAWSLEPVDDPLPLGLSADPNGATEAALASVPGLGPALASAIVEDRVARGPFTKLEDLDRVRGVGPAKLVSLAPWLQFPDSKQ